MTRFKNYLSLRLLGGLLGTGIPLLLARAMPDSDYASYLLALALASVIASLASLGMDRATYRYVPEALSADWGRAFLIRFITQGLALRLGCSLLLYLLAFQFFDTHLAAPLREHHGLTLLLLIAFSTSAFFSEICNGLLLHEQQARSTFNNLFLRLAAIAALFSVCEQINAGQMLLITLLTEILLIGSLIYPAVKTIRNLPDGQGDTGRAPGFSTLRHVALANYAAYLAKIPWESAMQRILLGTVAGTTELAAFGFMQTLADRAKAYLPARLLQNAIEPLLAERSARGRPQAEIAAPLNLLRKLNFCLLGGVLLALSIAGEAWLDLLSGNKFGAFAPIALLFVVQYISSSAITVAWASFNATNTLRQLTRLSILTSVAGLPILLLAARYFGPPGIVLANIGQSLLLFALLRFWQQHAAARGLWVIRQDIPLFGLMLSAFALGWALKLILPAIVASLFALAGFFAAVLALRILGHADWQQLEKLMARGI